MLSDPAPRPRRCYDPTTPPHRDDQGVHVYDRPTISALLRDPHRVTSDVTEMLTPAQRDRLHPVSCFVWATDRTTMSGCPGRHAALRAAMAPWFAEAAAAERGSAARAAAGAAAARVAGRPFDVFGDYAMPLVVAHLAGWLGVEPPDVTYVVDDQLAAGDLFATWPPLATPEMDERFRALMARPGLGGLAGAARDLVASGAITERESWGIVYAISVSAVATATAITLAVGLGVEHGLWPRLADTGTARLAVEEAVRLGTPFPQASRFARVPFAVGDVQVRPGEQVLMWLTAANRDFPDPARFDPWRDTGGHVGWGAGYHRCGGVHHARMLAAAAVTTLAERCPRLAVPARWARFVGIDDGFTAAPVEPIGFSVIATQGEVERVL